MRTNRRLDAQRFTCTHVPQDANGKALEPIKLTLTAGRVPGGPVYEIAITDAGKTGTGISVLLFDIGVWVSRIIQDRDPMTGEELDGQG